MASPLLNLIAVLMEFLSAFISLLVGYYAMKAYRKTSAKGLFTLSWGFLILGIGIFLRVFTAVYVSAMRGIVEASGELLNLINLGALIYSATVLVACGLFAATYIFQSKFTAATVAASGALAAAIPVFPIYKLFFIPGLELVTITLLSLVTANAFMNWQERKSSESAFVVSGFGLMLLSHVFFLFLPNNEMLLLYGQVTQLVGFLCLLTLLAKVSRTHA